MVTQEKIKVQEEDNPTMEGQGAKEEVEIILDLEKK